MSRDAGQAVLTPPIPQIKPQRVTYGGISAEALQSLGCMEGVYEPVVTRETKKTRAPSTLQPGYLLAGIVAAIAFGIHVLPVAPFTVAGEGAARHPISAAIIAIVAGALLRNVLPLPASIKPGCRHIVKKLIPIAIVLIGAQLNLSNIAGVGFAALVITLVCLVFSVAAGYGIGRLLGLGPKTSLLIGAGTGICGNSAIVAVAPLIDAEDDDVVLSIGTVNLFGLLAMLVWPVIGAALVMRSDAFGVWCGTTIHAVPQVVAAGFALDAQAGAMATLVKLVRVTMLAPLVFVLAMIHSKAAAERNTNDGLAVHYAKLVPWFVWAFVAIAVLNTLGLIPALQFPDRGIFAASALGMTSLGLTDACTMGGKILLTLAMAAIGLDVNVRELVGVGGKAVLAGFLSTAALGAVSLGLIWILL